MGLKVALTYNLKRKTDNTGLPDDFYSEFDSKETIKAIADGLRAGGKEVFLVEADKGLLNWFQNNKADIVFNIAEGLNGESRESQVPAILDFLGIPYTGSGILALSVSLNKTLTKKLFGQAGIPTPKYRLITDPSEVSDEGLMYPLITKPNSEGSGKGITMASVVRNRAELIREVEKTARVYQQQILVEEFIDGKELTVGILGNYPPTAMPVLEIDFSNCKASGEFFYTWKVKEFEKEVEESRGLSPNWHCPARLSRAEEKLVKETALKAFHTIGCVDLSRVDIMLGKDGVPYVLEVNPLPGLDPIDSNFPYIAKCAGLNYGDLMNRIVEVALERHNKSKSLALQERSSR
ncbi:MAG: ATP-grasp domain-containing protein [Candidatus Omnitrophica bacterium]|nr:ATP-grasp domain-containing protein [Candidatus Omnitrophota bacterium]